MNPPFDPEPGPCTCSPSTCRFGCALQVVDSLLQAAGSVRGEEVDALLDLRWLLRRHEHAEEVIRLFCRLRQMMEDRHYLALYRLRRWLENHIEVQLSVAGDEVPRIVRLRLQGPSFEAVRAYLVGSLWPPANSSAIRRVGFVFRTSVPPVPATAADSSSS